jgi:(p)ppGpp synthase/HD superfamily hydrolase
MTLARAVEIAAKVHNGQTDKGGEEYILHVIEVMLKAGASVVESDFTPPGFRQDVMIVGVLHDAIEDYEGLERTMLKHTILGEFGEPIYQALDAMTKLRSENYIEYIERVAQNPIARVVKIADLTHNMDTGRLPEGDIGEPDYQRWDKYRRALVRLKRDT